MNIVNHIRAHTDRELVAFIASDQSVSYGELFDFVSELTASLRAWRVCIEHTIPRIGVKAPNGLGYIITALSVLESGACFVPIPDELTQPEIDSLVGKTGLHGIITQVSDATERCLPLELGYLSLVDVPETNVDFPESAFNELNPAFIRFSSGTTAHSKGVVLSHESLLARITNANSALQLQAGEKILWTLPMAHHFAVSIILYLNAGVTTVLEDSHFPEAIYEKAKEHEVNFFYGSPFHYAQLAMYQKGAPLPHLRLAVSTASALDQEVADTFFERYQIRLCNALGIIEVGLPIINLQAAESHCEAIGQPLSCYGWRLTNLDEDGYGELEINGSGMFDAYLSPWQTRAEITEDGWFSTGDLATEVSEGTLQLVGRKKSVINIAGMKVFPEEIEACLNSLAQIKRVRVYALAHPIMGTVPVCDYIPTEPAAPPMPRDLRAYCVERLSSYKIPIQYNAVDTIALTASGKIKRHTSR